INAQSVIKPKVSPESDWDPSARIVFPTTGGGIKLLEQTPLLKAVLTDCITLATYELAYKDGYQAMPARDAFMSRIIRRVAKKTAGAVHIEKRAKKDMKFCQRLSPIVLTRVGNVRNDLRNAAISKVATLYELNKAGITPSQIRSIVKQLFTDQRYILPYAAESSAPGTDAGDIAADAVTGDNVTVSKPPPKVLKVFKTDKPFLAPIIIELIREIWWSSHKALGFKHVNDLKSNRKDRPTEVVLPDGMICLPGAHAWQTGVYIPAPEFSQGRLESTYKSLVTVMDEQRSKSPKIFNKLMHDLYLAVAILSQYNEIYQIISANSCEGYTQPGLKFVENQSLGTILKLAGGHRSKLNRHLRTAGLEVNQGPELHSFVHKHRFGGPLGDVVTVIDNLLVLLQRERVNYGHVLIPRNEMCGTPPGRMAGRMCRWMVLAERSTHRRPVERRIQGV
ncbi:hypothetical protein B0H14DRAFT_3585195, partial [Mycena olivaceomarginata]